MIGLGTNSAQIAALRTGQVVGLPNDIGVATKLEEEGVARILVRFGDIVPTFIMHVIFASDDAIQNRPEDLKKFLAGWFDTIRYMRQNKAEVVRIGTGVTRVTPEVESSVYDAVMPMFSEDGYFDPKATAGAGEILRRSEVAADRARYDEALHREILAPTCGEIAPAACGE